MANTAGGRSRTGGDCGPNQPAALGNFGDCKSLHKGLFELRIDWGLGYRIYYAMLGTSCVLLVCGGNKRKQPSDIERALGYLKDYKERTGTS